MAMLNIRLPADAEKQLAALAKKAGQTKASYARDWLLHLLEDFEDTVVAEKSLDEFYKSGEKAISLAEVKKQLALEN